jgi:hypothetical protein
MAGGSHIFFISPQYSANLLLNSHPLLILQEDYDASLLATAADLATRAPFFFRGFKLSALVDGDADDGDADDDGGDDGVGGTGSLMEVLAGAFLSLYLLWSRLVVVVPPLPLNNLRALRI